MLKKENESFKTDNTKLQNILNFKEKVIKQLQMEVTKLTNDLNDIKEDKSP